jgi:hypothetical protein
MSSSLPPLRIQHQSIGSPETNNETDPAGTIKPALGRAGPVFGREISNLKKLSPLGTVKGFYSHSSHFVFATIVANGSRRLRSDGETTFIGEVLEVFK